ncbi:PE family protein [Mycobacterium sp.]|uniref:PE family protein n=1 Tax=Mycobacterium sp. TaxID=1785 RepID=UPI002BACAD14|nr:PE family protein [Mycobacterium sp.]HTY33650.1 PE family protein [Mycobacterium sp.]
MSFLFADPEALAAAASDLSGIGSTLSTANTAAAAPTSAVAAAAADEVSAQVAAFLSEHGLGYQQISAQIATFHEQFVQTLSAGAGAYAAAEAGAAQNLAGAVNAPAATLLAGGGGVAGVAGAVGGAVSGAVNHVESVVAGSANFLGAGTGLLGGGAQAIASQAGAAASAVSGAAASAVSGAAVSAVSGAVSQVESVVAGSANFLGGGLFGGVSQAAALLLGPTGGIRALTAASALLSPAAVTNAAAVSAANAFAPIADAIESAYLLVEPWVQYGFELASYAAGWLPWIGWIVAPQIMFVYNLFEPMVQSGLFNILDWLGGSITFVQGLNNFLAATTASINYFIQTEINWFLGFLPPLPPFPPFFP